MPKVTSYLVFIALRVFLFPFSLLSPSSLGKVAKALTPLIFTLHTSFRKRALSNLATACNLNLDYPSILRIAKESLTNLIIVALEYGKLSKVNPIENLARCVNPEIAYPYIEKDRGVIFFCAHQANWELLFLEGTKRMRGMAIGRPQKNLYLYQWILKIRQRFGGKIIPPKEAYKESMRALKAGIFVGIVGDQGMPDSPFSSSFLGRNAYTSPLPALLAYRASVPLFFATTHREDSGRYSITYEGPFHPNKDNPMDVEVPRLMKILLNALENSLKRYPSEWLWQHNRWKQKLPGVVAKRFRHDTIAILLPEDKEEALKLSKELSIFRIIYPMEWIQVFSPIPLPNSIGNQMIPFSSLQELFRPWYEPKLVFNFTQEKKLKNHFLKYSAFEVFNWQDLSDLAKTKLPCDLQTLLLKASQYDRGKIFH